MLVLNGFAQFDKIEFIHVDSIQLRTKNYKVSGLNAKRVNWTTLQLGIVLPLTSNNQKFTGEAATTSLRICSERKNDII
ncbi:MAG: hypothetical protein ACKO8Q_06135, partial [Bacteroidota bacterium]